ncbi:MAG: type II secretion system protein [Thiobacillus sp.]
MYAINRRTCGGFTMVELVLVILIGGVLAAVAVPRMVDRSAFQTHGGAAEVRTALRYAQRLAMAKNREVCVATSLNDLKLTFDASPTPGVPPNVCGQNVVGPDGDVLKPYTVTIPVGLATTPITVFRFNGQGRPTSNAAVPLPGVLPSNAAVTLIVGGSVNITVQPETGYVQ